MNVDTMRLLVAKGLSAQDILEIAETMDAPKPRSAAAERQARYRARRKGECVTSDVTRDGDGDVTPSLSLPPNEINSNPPALTLPDNTPRARKADFPKPEWADPQVWADLLKNRKTKRLPNTATAYAQMLADIDKLSAETGWPPGECLRACVARGWGAIFDPRTGNNGRGNQTFGGNAGGRDRRDGLTRALDRELGLDPPERYSAGGTGTGGGNPVARLAALR